MNIEECVKDGERLLEIRDVQILKTDYERWCSEEHTGNRNSGETETGTF